MFYLQQTYGKISNYTYEDFSRHCYSKVDIEAEIIVIFCEKYLNKELWGLGENEFSKKLLLEIKETPKTVWDEIFT